MSNDSSTCTSGPDDVEVPSTIADLEFEAALEALLHPHRRHALSYLIEDGGFVPVDDLYDHVACEIELSETESDARTRVEAAFHHWHRPMLEDMELIEYYDGDDLVRAREPATDLELLLELST